MVNLLFLGYSFSFFNIASSSLNNIFDNRIVSSKRSNPPSNPPENLKRRKRSNKSKSKNLKRKSNSGTIVKLSKKKIKELEFDLFDEFISKFSKVKITISPNRVIYYDKGRYDILANLFFKDPAGIIAGYEYENFMQNIFNELVEGVCKNDSKPFCKPLKLVKFDSFDELKEKLLDKEFMKNFTALANLIFQHDHILNLLGKLKSFIIKCLLIVRQRYPNIYGKDRDRWNQVLESMNSLKSVNISKVYTNFVKILGWSSRTKDLNSFKFECLENWTDLKPRFEELLDDFYSRDKGSCLDIVSKHFGERRAITNGFTEIIYTSFKSYFNRNPLLAFLWKYQDPNSWTKCFKSLKNTRSSYSNTEEEIENFHLNRDRILTLAFDLNSTLHSKSRLKVIVENDQKISWNNSNFYQILFFKLFKILEDTNRFTWENLLNVFSFKNDQEDSKHSIIEDNLKQIIPFFQNSSASLIFFKALKLYEDYKKQPKKKKSRLHLPNTKITSFQYEEYYERILQNLGYKDPLDPKFIKRNGLQFDRIAFLENFYKVMKRFDSFKSFHDSHDLLRLFFKWTIYVRESFLKDYYHHNPDALFQRINPLFKLLRVCFPFPYSEYDLEKYFPEFYFNLGQRPAPNLDFLMTLEFYERLDEMLPAFKRALNTFYNPGPDKGDCRRLEDLHFGGRFENNLILTNMIWTFKKYNFFGESKDLDLMRECISFPRTVFMEAGLGEKLIVKSNDFLEILSRNEFDYPYLNRQFLSSYKSTKKQNENYFIIRISSLNDFMFSLLQLEKIESLDQETIQMLFGFKDSDWKWNKDQFIKFKRKMKEIFPTNLLNNIIGSFDFNQ